MAANMPRRHFFSGKTNRGILTLAALAAMLVWLPHSALAEQTEAAPQTPKPWIPAKQSASGAEVPRLGGSAAGVFQGLVYSAGAVLLLAAVFRKLRPENKLGTQCGIDIVGRRQLGSKTALLLIETEGQRFLLAQTPEEISLLSAIEPVSSFDRALCELSAAQARDETDKAALRSANA